MTEETWPNCTQDHTSSPHAASQLFFLRQEFFFPSPLPPLMDGYFYGKIGGGRFFGAFV